MYNYNKTSLRSVKLLLYIVVLAAIISGIIQSNTLSPEQQEALEMQQQLQIMQHLQGIYGMGANINMAAPEEEMMVQQGIADFQQKNGRMPNATEEAQIRSTIKQAMGQLSLMGLKGGGAAQAPSNDIDMEEMQQSNNDEFMEQMQQQQQMEAKMRKRALEEFEQQQKYAALGRAFGGGGVQEAQNNGVDQATNEVLEKIQASNKEINLKTQAIADSLNKQNSQAPAQEAQPQAQEQAPKGYQAKSVAQIRAEAAARRVRH